MTLGSWATTSSLENTENITYDISNNLIKIIIKLIPKFSPVTREEWHFALYIVVKCC